MDPQLFCLRWNNHQTNLLSVFDQLLQVEAFCDVTLAVDGASLKCHKMVLAACSNYFQNLFMENTCKHPIVFLKDITFNQIRALLDYMYHGEVSVQEEELPALLKIAEALKVKGLVEADDNKPNHNTSPVRPKVTSTNSHGLPSANPKLPIWPVSTNKLLSPKAKSESGQSRHSNNDNPTEEDPGHLVIDEESNDGGNITMSPLDADYAMDYLNDDTPPAPGMVKTINAAGKVEWKRYKQYTKDDILAAIEEVKAGCSALQASRKYGVPSRTLYDKVKKMGILTANMQKQLQQKKASETKYIDNNMQPISLLGMQLPQSGLPQVPVSSNKHNGNTPPFSSAMMLSMIEKMKAVAGAGLVKPPLGSTPLNLSAMLDSNSGSGGSGQGSEDDSQKSTESKSSDEVEIKEEDPNPETDIRAQFFADLKRLNDSKSEALNQDNNHQTSVIKSLNEFSNIPTNGDRSAHSVTLKVRDDDESLPPRKRKFSHENSLAESPGDCKKLVIEDDLEPAIKLETTSY
eukprot:TRINITY_DN2295_c0_g1_i1.p1 TRINITY_DN2295_c0_g1~~TRINITY_DN2295_c0_g1_i1.p1  ORF type:complete len:517 (+),score=122.96 TRINITY_DN2295_c0_g1_i1:220-1770(+)